MDHTVIPEQQPATCKMQYRRYAMDWRLVLLFSTAGPRWLQLGELYVMNDGLDRSKQVGIQGETQILNLNF